MGIQFWHLQMHQGLSSGGELSLVHVKSIILENRIIGIGEWKDKKRDQCRQFKENLKNGDIVMVRKGLLPIALVQVSGDNLKGPIYDNQRNVVVLSYFDEYIEHKLGKYAGQALGSLTKVDNKGNPTGKFIIGWYNLIQQNMTIVEVEKILKSKFQVILQGPPGTGKTRLAKRLVRDLCLPTEISEKEIVHTIKSGIKINSISDYTTYTVVGLTSTAVSLKLQTGTLQSPSFNKIIEAFKKKKWEGGTVGGDAYESAIAKYIYNSILPPDQYKIIQFHPAYSYEDFVRGITAKSNGSSIEYKTENKILAKLAQSALENYLNSKKEPEQLSKQNWISTKLTSFIEILSKELSENGKIALTGKGFVYEIEDECLRYKGEEWATQGRINLLDLTKVIEANIGKPMNELLVSKDVSVHAWYRASYYMPILTRFFSHAGEYKSQDVPKELLKSYVLIIDEINRANLPAVLGELIYALEYRDEEVESMYELEGKGNKLILPPNLYIIGTMNTADRSVGHIDYAIRRRFAFVDVLPIPDPIKEFARPEFEKVSNLFIKNYNEYVTNREIKLIPSDFLSSDFRPEDVWIGHSYFITKKDGEEGKKELDIKMKYEVVPLLKEYIKDGILSESARVEIDKL